MIEIQKIAKITQGDSSLNKSSSSKINSSTKTNNDDAQKNYLKLQAILQQKPKNDKNSKSNTTNKSSQQGIPELKLKDLNVSKQNNNVIIKKHDEQKKQIKDLPAQHKIEEKHSSKQEIQKYENVMKKIKTNPKNSIQQVTKKKEEQDSSYQPLQIHKPLQKEKTEAKVQDEFSEEDNNIIIQKKNSQKPIVKQDGIKKDLIEQQKKVQPQIAGQNNNKQQSNNDIGNQRLMELLNSSSHNKKKNLNKSKEKQKQEQGKLNDLKNQNSHINKTVKKDIKEQQNHKSKIISIKPKIKELSIQKIKQQQQRNQINDDYDLNDSFINDSESVGAEIDPNLVVSELKKLQRKKEGIRLNDEDDDIEEVGFDAILKEDKKSRVQGIIDDYREEKYIKKEMKKEKKQKKKLLHMMKSKQEQKIKDAQ